MTTKKIAQTSILLAITLLLGIIENALPPVLPILPYAKLGISNFAILMTLLLLNWKYATLIVVIKCVVIAIFSGVFSQILYSLPSGLVSLFVMVLLIKTKKLSLIAISCVGGIVHNLIQIFSACLQTQSVAPMAFIPYLCLFGGVAGAVVGCLAYFMVKFMPSELLKD